ncbi:hypothetical protein G9A89_009781 [Geosiphon pyriformis]|nr:hypothetical protein G9A89_009781 [Geosiphon pyriformis]
MPNLSYDVLAEIFSYSEDKQLYQLLFVNHHWASIAAQSLWSNPFNVQFSVYKASIILEVYLSCLAEVEKQKIIETGINLSQIFKTATFQYASFLKTLEFGKITHLIKKFCQKQHDTKVIRDRKQDTIIIQALLNMFTTYSLGMRSATIDRLYYENTFVYTQLLLTPDAASLRSRINEIKEFSVDIFHREYFSKFAEVWTNIEHLKLTVSLSTTIKAAILPEQLAYTARFIAAQKNLKSFNFHPFHYPQDYTEIIYALSQQYKTLCSLEFHQMNFVNTPSLELLTKCKKLQKLTFKFCLNFDDDLLKALYSAEFPCLTSVHVEVQQNFFCTPPPINKKYAGLLEWTKKINGVHFCQ